jgi:hypothetical protein
MCEYTIKMNRMEECSKFIIVEQGRFCRHDDELGVPEKGSSYLDLETTTEPTSVVHQSVN